jgi:hypothetical protein
LVIASHLHDRPAPQRLGKSGIVIAEHPVRQFPEALPYTKNAVSPERKSTIDRKPPDLPSFGRAIRCLITPPPRSASIKPFSALATAAHKSASSSPCRRAKRANHLVLKTLEFGASPGPVHSCNI